MNKTILIGRLTRDAEVRSGKTPYARYTLAVDRPTKDGGADFINIVAFGKQADFASKYLSKGSKVLVEGHITTGSYTDKNGKVQYTTDVIVDRHEFVESKKVSAESQDIPENNLPFN